MPENDTRPKPLTLHQRRVLEEWESADHPTQTQIAAKFATTQSAISRTLREARLRRYGATLARGGKRVMIRTISLGFCSI